MNDDMNQTPMDDQTPAADPMQAQEGEENAEELAEVREEAVEELKNEGEDVSEEAAEQAKHDEEVAGGDDATV